MANEQLKKNRMSNCELPSYNTLLIGYRMCMQVTGTVIHKSTNISDFLIENTTHSLPGRSFPDTTFPTHKNPLQTLLVDQVS